MFYSFIFVVIDVIKASCLSEIQAQTGLFNL